MHFIDRRKEMARLDEVMQQKEAAFVVVWGRRRIGKTRLLLEWVHKYGGIYGVADESSSSVQRKYFSRVLSATFNGFADADYPDWDALLNRLAHEARHRSWRGPIVLDE